MMTDIDLVRPDIAYKESYLTALNEIQDASEKSAWIYLGDSAPLDIPQNDFSAYVDTLLQRETQPPPEFVCDTIYWAVHKGEVAGRISIRHELNDFLRKVGGHIGYITRPSWRGKGVASEMLEKILDTEKAKSIGNLLLTCDENNSASEKTIIKNHGKYEGTFSAGPNRSAKKHFWINLKAPFDHK
jgi:predicted acetyltransferase